MGERSTGQEDSSSWKMTRHRHNFIIFLPSAILGYILLLLLLLRLLLTLIFIVRATPNALVYYYVQQVGLIRHSLKKTKLNFCVTYPGKALFSKHFYRQVKDVCLFFLNQKFEHMISKLFYFKNLQKQLAAYSLRFLISLIPLPYQNLEVNLHLYNAHLSASLGPTGSL